MWRVALLPILSLLALLPLVPLPSRPAQVIGTSRLPPLRKSGSPLLSRLFAKELLYRLADGPADHARIAAAHAQPVLRKLNRTAVPLLALCRAPSCHETLDLLVLTLLHKHGMGGPAHNPHRGVVEQWARPAAHYLRQTAAASASGAVAHAARRGLAAALRQLAEQVRVALHPQLLSDPDEWRLLWRQILPGPGELIAASADGRRLAVCYHRIEGQTVSMHIRHYLQSRESAAREPPAPEEEEPEEPRDIEAIPANADEDGDEGGRTGGDVDEMEEAEELGLWTPSVEYEDLSLEGNLPISAVALAGSSCLVYARAHDSRLFRVMCRNRVLSRARASRKVRRSRKRSSSSSRGSSGSHRRQRLSSRSGSFGELVSGSRSAAIGQVSEWRPRAWWQRATWRPMTGGPAVDRRKGQSETVLLWALPAGYALRAKSAVDEIGLLLAGQLAPVGGPSRPSQPLTARPTELGLSLRLLSPPRRQPWSCRRRWLRWLRRRGCRTSDQWTLRAGTSAQPAATREAGAFTADQGDSAAAMPRPLLSSSLGAEHTSVTFAHTITTVHTTHRITSVDRAKARRGLAHSGNPAQRGRNERSERSASSSRRSSAAHAQEGRRGGSLESGEAMVSAVMLELQVEGVGSAPFRIVAHERDGPRLALLVGPREILVLSRDHATRRTAQGAADTADATEAREKGAVPDSAAAASHTSAATSDGAGEKAAVLPRQRACPHRKPRGPLSWLRAALPDLSRDEAGCIKRSHLHQSRAGAAGTSAGARAEAEIRTLEAAMRRLTSVDTTEAVEAVLPGLRSAVRETAAAARRRAWPDAPSDVANVTFAALARWAGADVGDVSADGRVLEALDAGLRFIVEAWVREELNGRPGRKPTRGAREAGAPAKLGEADKRQRHGRPTRGRAHDRRRPPSRSSASSDATTSAASGATSSSSAAAAATSSAASTPDDSGGLISSAATAMLADDGSDDDARLTWRLEAANLPRLAGLPSKAEPLAMLLLPSPASQAAILVMYEGGALASFNLTDALVASAEYAAGGTAASPPTRSALTIALTVVALVALVIGLTMLIVGMRLGMATVPSVRPIALIRAALRVVAELMLTPAVAAFMLLWPARLPEATADERPERGAAERPAPTVTATADVDLNMPAAPLPPAMPPPATPLDLQDTALSPLHLPAPLN